MTDGTCSRNTVEKRLRELLLYVNQCKRERQKTLRTGSAMMVSSTGEELRENGQKHRVLTRQERKQ